MPPKTAAKTMPAEVPSEGPFYVAASRPPVGLPACSVLATASWSSMAAAISRPPRAAPPGLFHQDTRYLSRLDLLVNGSGPATAWLQSARRQFGVLRRSDQSRFPRRQRLILEKDTVHILRAIFLWRNRPYQRFGVRHYGDRPSTCHSRSCSRTACRPVRSPQHRERRGTATAKVRSDDQVLLIYHGLDNRVRHTTVNFDPPPNRLATNAATYDLRLAPKETRPLFVAVSCNRTDSRPPPFLRGRLAARRELRAATRNQTSVETSNDRFNEVLCRSAADLTMLMTDTPQGRYPYAGIPWFSTTFGRDGLDHGAADALVEPGRCPWRVAGGASPPTRPRPRILLPMRSRERSCAIRGGEMAALREVPFGLYSAASRLNSVVRPARGALRETH